MGRFDAQLHFVGPRGMHLEFHHPEYRTPIVTSAIQEIIEECHEQSEYPARTALV
jgi:hypothetical protein